jgi:hypothetical protein
MATESAVRFESLLTGEERREAEWMGEQIRILPVAFEF